MPPSDVRECFAFTSGGSETVEGRLAQRVGYKAEAKYFRTFTVATDLALRKPRPE